MADFDESELLQGDKVEDALDRIGGDEEEGEGDRKQ